MTTPLDAFRSLVIGVQELAAEWPHLDLPSEGRHNDLIGFLFATLPLSEAALVELSQSDALTLRALVDEHRALQAQVLELAQLVRQLTDRDDARVASLLTLTRGRRADDHRDDVPSTPE